jgi:7-keto-8-aminopelargonate synthetase-like enzyme
MHKTDAKSAMHFRLSKQTNLIMGTFSKSLASVGGFISASEEIIHYIKHFSRALIFSASLPPASTASVLEALKIMKEEPERIDKLWENTHFMAKGFTDMGFNIGKSTTPVIPLYIGDMMRTFKMWRLLAEDGVFINPVVPPAVPQDSCLIRCSFMATHTKEQLETALYKFKKAGKTVGVI